MPLIDLHLPAGALTPHQRTGLADELTTVLRAGRAQAGAAAAVVGAKR